MDILRVGVRTTWLFVGETLIYLNSLGIVPRHKKTSTLTTKI